MSNTNEIASAIRHLKKGDDRGVETLWSRFFHRLVGLARRKMEMIPREVRDEEGVALSAMHSLCRGMKAGRFERVEDRHDLWRLLVAITSRKACRDRRYEFSQKRDVRRTKREHTLDGLDSQGRRQAGFDGLAVEPTPQLACEIAETCDHLLGGLDAKSRAVAMWTLEGYSTKEIAKRLNCVRRTVERKRERIRDKWSRMGFGPAAE